MQKTRHGNYGGPRGLYGSFSGKVETVGPQVLYNATARIELWKTGPATGLLQKVTPATGRLEA